MTNIVTFYVPRREDYPQAADYVSMLRLGQKFCDRLALRHVVLTDAAGHEEVKDFAETHVTDLPRNLMRAVVEAQASWLKQGDWKNADSLLVGADCFILKPPDSIFPPGKRASLVVTFRPGHKRYPINTGAIMCRSDRREDIARIFQAVADRAGPKWGDDQRAIEAELGPMPKTWGTYERHGLNVAFVPMAKHNDSVRTIHDNPFQACVVHMRGKDRKPIAIPWAENMLAFLKRTDRGRRP